jgi:hypothetical protein
MGKQTDRHFEVRYQEQNVDIKRNKDDSKYAARFRFNRHCHGTSDGTATNIHFANKD